MFLAAIGKATCHGTDAMVETREPLVLKYNDLRVTLELSANGKEIYAYFDGTGSSEERKRLKSYLEKAVRDVGYNQRKSFKLLFKDGKKRR